MPAIHKWSSLADKRLVNSVELTANTRDSYVCGREVMP